jgi:hypothetical protein
VGQIYFGDTTAKWVRFTSALTHTHPAATHHYSMAQIVELHTALERIKEDASRWNKSLATLKLEQRAARRDASPAAKNNGLEAQASRPLL